MKPLWYRDTLSSQVGPSDIHGGICSFRSTEQKPHIEIARSRVRIELVTILSTFSEDNSYIEKVYLSHNRSDALFEEVHLWFYGAGMLFNSKVGLLVRPSNPNPWAFCCFRRPPPIRRKFPIVWCAVNQRMSCW